MKNLLLSVFFALVVSSTAFAYYHASENDGYGQGDYSTYAETQPAIPNSLAYRICEAAQPTLYPYTEMTTPQLFEGYEDGVVTITYLGADSADSHKSLYRVSAGSGTVIISIVDDL